MSILRAGIGLGLSVALAAGCSKENDGLRELERTLIQREIYSLDILPPEAPTVLIGTYKNAHGENIELTVRDGEPYIERRDFSRYAGLLVDCYVRPISSRVYGREVLNRTLIAVRVGESVDLEIATPNDAKATTHESDSSETIFCQPEFVSDVFPPLDGETPLESSDLRKYCMEVPRDSNGAAELSTNLSACRVSF